MKKILIIILLIWLDQISKYGAMNHLDSPFEIFSFFSLNFVQNEGIAFSLPVSQYFIIPLSFLAIGWLGWQIYIISKKQLTMDNRKGYILLLGVYSFILAGAMGNLIDRLIYGKVTDFLSFWNFPVFNLADTWITIGIGLFILGEFFQTSLKLKKDIKI